MIRDRGHGRRAGAHRCRSRCLSVTSKLAHPSSREHPFGQASLFRQASWAPRDAFARMARFPCHFFPGLPGSLCLPPLREAERRNGADNNRGTCAKAPRLPVRGAGAPSGAPPRRLWARGPSSRRTRCFHLLSRRLSPPFIQPVQPRRGDPRSRADGDPGASRGHAYEARPQDAAPRSVSRTSPEDALR